MTKKEFNLKGLGELEYILYVEGSILHIKAKKVCNSWGKHSTYKVLKKDIKLINSVLDTIEFISNNKDDSQLFSICYQKNSLIFYLHQVKNNLNKNLLEFKATLVDRKEF